MSSLKAEVRDLRTLLLGFISPNSSHSSYNDSNPPTSNLPREKHQATARIASKDPPPNADEENDSDRNSQPNSQESEMQREPEFEPLMQATVAIEKFVRELYPPLVSEYVSAILAWQLLTHFYQAINREGPLTQSHGHPKRTSHRQQRANLRKTSRQLLALRQFCIREGLTEAVLAAEVAFGVTEATRDKWTKTDERNSKKQRRWRELLALKSTATAEDRDREWAVRINTWLYQTLESHPDHAGLHQALHLQVFRAYQGGGNEAGSSLDRMNLLGQLEERGGWRKQVLRYWFLDDAMAWTPGSNSQSSVPDTEATILPIAYETDEDDVGDLLGSGNTSKTPLPITIADEMDTPSRQPDIFSTGEFVLRAHEDYYLNIKTCGGGAPAHRKDAARVALKDYGGDPDDFPRGEQTT